MNTGLLPRRGAWKGVVTTAMLSAVTLARAVTVGEAAPDFQLPSLQASPAGNTLKLSALRGQVVYLDFWASWCGPCKQSFPWMNALQQRYGAKGLQVVAINLDEEASDAHRFLAQVPAQFRVAFDRTSDTPKRYAIVGMPTSVLIGADGQVLMVHTGFRADDTATLESAIQHALAP
jgi:cytochrome c biogenesis protein CcmG/thiol:disulfide interchange protein DsbE